MAFEIQELPDIIRVIILLNLTPKKGLEEPVLKYRIDKVCTGYACVDMRDVDIALKQMSSQGLVRFDGHTVQLTEQGARLGGEWRSLLLKKEPIMEIVAGLVDGSITGLVVILSAFVANLLAATAAFAAFLTLSAVAITNFSSFLLGGITEDLADMQTLQNLMHYSLSDIEDIKQRDKSILLLKHLFMVLHKEISRSNIVAAVICGTTTYVAGIVPILAYLFLPGPFNFVLSLTIVAGIVGVFLVRYRSRRTKVPWKITLFETIAIVAIAALASLIIGGAG